MTNALAFFGAFNPPTVAHLQLAEFALRETGREQVIFVPSKAVYIRDEQRKDFAYSDEQRLNMLRLTAKSRHWMRVTDWEMTQARQPRTYETLCHLRDEGIEASLLLGSDKLPELEHGWQYVANIAREFGIVCLSRGEDDCERIVACFYPAFLAFVIVVCGIGYLFNTFDKVWEHSTPAEKVSMSGSAAYLSTEEKIELENQLMLGRLSQDEVIRMKKSVASHGELDGTDQLISSVNERHYPDE